MPKSVGKQMSINIIASIVSFAVTVGINFFLTPYLVKEVGSEFNFRQIYFNCIP